MPPSRYEVLQAFLSAMATTEDASWTLYLIALLQLLVGASLLFKGVRHHKMATALLLVSLLALPALLALGYFLATTRPVA